MKKHNSLLNVIKGNGVEFVFSTDKSTLIISGGQIIEVSLRINDGVGNISICSNGKSDKEIFTGGASAASAQYQEICMQLLSQDSGNRASWIKRGAIAVSFIAALYAGVILSANSPPIFEPSVESENVMRIIDENIELGKHTKYLEETLKKLQLQPKPSPLDELRSPLKPVKPAEQVTEPETKAPVDEVKANDRPGISAIPSFGLPTYKPTISNDNVDKIVEAPADVVPLTVIQPQIAEPDSITEQKADAVAKDDPKPNGTSVIKPTAKEAGKETKTNEVKAETQPEIPVLSDQEAAKQATDAVQGLIKKGLTPEGANDVLGQLEALSQVDLDQITPEMIADLPHEVALILRDNGLIGDLVARPEGLPYRIIKLPDEILDQYRGKDGIPTIPEANSWAATGNMIRLPPPGGGDITSVEDMRRFGIEP